MYSVGKFAKLIGKTVRTLQNWDINGKLICKRTPSGRRYYTEEDLLKVIGHKVENKLNIAYCRVSTRNQKDDLENQKIYINDFSRNSGINIDDFFIDYGSGLNYNREKFNKLLELVEHNKIKNIIIAHRDRFMRFGYDWFEHFCMNHGTKILVINDDRLSPEKELVDDIINILHVFSCRLYGLRKYKKTIESDKDILNDLKS